MYHRFSAAELNRLLDLAAHIASSQDCSPARAIELIEGAVTGAKLPAARPANSVVGFADGLRRMRMRRKEILGTVGFRDPVWDMLLDLLVAYRRGQSMTVTALCHGSGVPQTTALRYLDRMEAGGMIHRTQDARDLRRTLVAIEPDLVPRIEYVLGEIQACA